MFIHLLQCSPTDAKTTPVVVNTDHLIYAELFTLSTLDKKPITRLTFVGNPPASTLLVVGDPTTLFPRRANPPEGK